MGATEPRDAQVPLSARHITFVPANSRPTLSLLPIAAPNIKALPLAEVLSLADRLAVVVIIIVIIVVIIIVVIIIITGIIIVVVVVTDLVSIAGFLEDGRPALGTVPQAATHIKALPLVETFSLASFLAVQAVVVIIIVVVIVSVIVVARGGRGGVGVGRGGLGVGGRGA